MKYPHRHPIWITTKKSIALFAVAVGVIGAHFVGSSLAAATCNLNATTSNFSSQVTAATAGQTICLASGNYGTWAGTNKAITVTPASGAAAQMQVNFGSGDSGFTIDGLTGMGGAMTGGVTNVTIKNSTFTSTIDIEGATNNVVLDNNTHNWNVGPSTGGANAKIFVNVSGTIAAPALTIKNSQIINGDLDGIHIGGGSGLVILDNTFSNLCDKNANHTDNIQFEGGSQVRIAGNYVYAAQSCATQGITSFDGGTNGVIIENNVVDIPRDWGIELYQDHSSIIRHNTVVWHDKAYSEFNSETGHIDIGNKSGQSCGSGTIARDNIADAGGACPVATDHNVSGKTATYVGPTTTYAGFKLAANSPVGRNAASDGTDVGITISGGTTNPPPTDPATYHLADLSTLLAHFGQTTGMTAATGDHNADGAVNGYDLGILLADYSP